MIEKIAKYLILSILGLAALTFVAILVIDDETIESSAGGAAGTLLGIKHGVYDTVGAKSDSFVYWIRTTIHEVLNFSPTNRTPRVVMRVPPPPKEIEPAPASIPAQQPEPAMPAAPEPAMPENASDTSTMEQSAAPMSQQSAEPADLQPPGTAEPMPTAPASRGETDSPPPPPPPSALGFGESMQEGAPAPQPIAGVEQQPLDKPAMEQAALPPGAEAPPADAPPPPPSAEEARPGESDYQQGLKYYNGDGVEQNFGKAAQFFLKAGEAGHVGAQYNLGIMNYTGQTGGQDFANAAKWFERAASSGHTQAQYNLGFLYYEGKGVAQDLKTAFDWINRAAEQGYPKAVKARDAFKQAMPEMFSADKSAN
ncbi:MAG: SEL1-like repeat protein [Rhodospirillales bacterium]|nr:SEL1-like repeat protein [Rhodospirillales bacterium]MBO6785749.1 SEL1-like repeat protein [Rhodospirillales bacterium]